MICRKCNCQNEDSALYCQHCGSPMRHSANKGVDVSSILILIWIVLTAVANIAIWVITHNVYMWYMGPAKIIVYGIYVFENLLMFLPALAIKNLTLKIIGTVITAIGVLWYVYNNIHTMLT